MWRIQILRNANINNAIARSLSRDRLDKYLNAAGSNLDIAIGIYERNTRLSEAFYTPLQAMEVCFRNHLDLQMIAAYGDDWMLNGAPPLRQNTVNFINRAVADLRQANAPFTPGAVVAELSFGFWVALLGPRYDATIWRKTLYQAFMDNGRRMSRQIVHGRFNALRRFRNRIAHHEPIFQIDLERSHREIIGALIWMCPETAAWADYHSRFPATFATP